MCQMMRSLSCNPMDRFQIQTVIAKQKLVLHKLERVGQPQDGKIHRLAMAACVQVVDIQQPC
jgi:hypothetical protein